MSTNVDTLFWEQSKYVHFLDLLFDLKTFLAKSAPKVCAHLIEELESSYETANIAKVVSKCKELTGTKEEEIKECNEYNGYNG